jgi:hypothetical protein
MSTNLIVVRLPSRFRNSPTVIGRITVDVPASAAASPSFGFLQRRLLHAIAPDRSWV